MPALKLAKRAAAFQAIKRLYEAGELTENLMPYKGDKCLEQFTDTYFNAWKQFPNGIPYENH